MQKVRHFIVFLIVFVLLLASGVAATRAQTAPAWQPNTPYAVNALASYNGTVYRCIQAHTSLPGWEPPNVAALWAVHSGGTNPTNTPVPPATNTPQGPQPTATRTPTQSSGGTCTAPAWNATAVYTQGNVVSHNGRQYRARWWTQNENPSTSGQWGVWEDLGPCSGGTIVPTNTPSRTPTATNTAQVTFQPPTNTPNGPTLTPSIVPTIPNTGIPRRVLVGYWHNFNNGSGIIRLRDVSIRWDVINIAFAIPVGNDGTLSFVPEVQDVASFKDDVRYLQSIGKKVQISIGGAEGQVSITDATKRANYVNSLVAVIQEYGFNGIDIDLEGSSVALSGNDPDLKNPTSPGVTNLIAGTREIRNRFGAGFMVTMAPETANVQGGYSAYGGGWGSYLPLMHGLRDILTFVHVQHYNSGGMPALDGRNYTQGTADFQVAMAEMLLQGFNAPSTSNNFFPPLRPDQVAIGLPASPQAAGGGYTSSADIDKAVRYLVTGQSFGGSYVLRQPSGYANFRGLMTWSINWDSFFGFVFSTNSRNLLNSLP
jgi:chitinase